MRSSFSQRSLSGRHGAALVIILAFVVLLTVLVVAYFSRAISERQVANSSANQTKCELFAKGAVESIIGDLKQEIADPVRSTGTSPAPGITIYRPAPGNPAAAAPALVGVSGTVPGLENLVKRSASGLPFYTGGVSRAAPLSTTAASQNGRYISPARWNQHLLIQRFDQSSASDTTPVKAFTPPDWILVARSGTNPTIWDPSMAFSPTKPTSVVGRYAYAIYNEGGLLDANAAGYPSAVPLTPPPSASAITNQTIYKSALSYADLTQIGLTQPQIDQIVGWRNNATVMATGSVGSYSIPSSSSVSDNYLALSTRSTNKFLATFNTAFNPNGTGNGNVTDRMFTSRQQLMDLLLNGVAQSSADKASLSNALEYLGTFSRYLNQPSYWPDPSRPKGQAVPIPTSVATYVLSNSSEGEDDTYNPPFRQIRVTGTFPRNDGSVAAIGEPLIKKRFALNRLAWLTCKGPSGNLKNLDVPLNRQYLADGITQQTLDEGTDTNIRNYFGLTWTPGPPNANDLGGYWNYIHGFSSSGGQVIGTLDLVRNANREPDFFELLKAGICVGSLANGWNANGANLGQMKADMRVDFQILQIAANIIDQTKPDSYPTHIVFNDGTLNNSFWGRVNLPYLTGISYQAIAVAAAIPAPGFSLPTRAAPVVSSSNNLQYAGLQVLLDVPIIWNPMVSNSGTAAFSPSNLRIAVSTANDASGQFKGVVGYGISTNGTSANPAIAPVDYCQWESIGQVDPVTGTIVMPDSGKGPNTALYFSNSANLYRDPTPLWRPGFPTGSNLSIDKKNLIVTSGSIAWDSGIPAYNSNTTKIIGFYAYPYGECATQTSTDPVTKKPVYTTYALSLANPGPFWGTHDLMTCSLEYQAGSSSWIPYMQYNLLTRATDSLFQPYTQDPPCDPQSWFDHQAQQEIILCDPRSTRWGVPSAWAYGMFIDSSTGTHDGTILKTIRTTGTAVGSSHGNGTPAGGWYQSGSGQNVGLIPLGSVSQNIYSASSPYYYYQDPDSTVRRGMAGAVLGYNGIPNGNPTAIPTTTYYNGLGNPPANVQNRPIILNRPFRSVAELGYVFRDTPWKNVSFSIPESGDAALLDIFCIAEDTRPDSLASGKVDLNTRQPLVIQSILAGAYRDELGTSGSFSATEAASLANALVARTTGTAPGQSPLVNVGDLVGRFTPQYKNANDQPYAGFSEDLTGPYTGGTTSTYNLVQRFRETAVRALSDTGMAGTWNLLIDVVAQTGRYAGSASTLANFTVEGERRYWVHLAIDRQTGTVIDEQIEQVNE